MTKAIQAPTSLRERRRQLLHDEILQAAQALLAEKGLMMSMEELAARVGISKPTLYSYFSTKDELIIMAAIQMMDQAMAMIDEHQQDYTPLQRLALFLRTILSYQVDQETMQPRPWRQEVLQFLQEHEESRQLLCRVDEVVVSLTNEAIAQGEIDPRFDAAMVVRVFYALTHTLNVGHKSTVGAPDTATIADIIAILFERGVRA